MEFLLLEETLFKLNVFLCRGYAMIIEGQEKDDFWSLLGGKGTYSSDPVLRVRSRLTIYSRQCMSNALPKYIYQNVEGKNMGLFLYVDGYCVMYKVHLKLALSGIQNEVMSLDLVSFLTRYPLY